jgi:pyruvate formate lyase activating enzyme
VLVTNIQRFCLHDGPGIRTTVFLKGCNLKCPWCANPENISVLPEKYYNSQDDDGANGIYGYNIDLEDLKKEILKDKTYYEKNGGVTFSGGEPLLQVNSLEPLLEDLKKQSINICFETALFVKKEFLEKAIKYADEFIVDIKILQREECRKILNGNIDIYYENLNFLFKNSSNVIFRIPLTEVYTLNDDNILLILDLLKKYKPIKVEIFKVHSLAEKKYKSLNKSMENIKIPSDDKVLELKNKIQSIKIDAEICSI